jgi:hypothetical protein
VKVSGAYWAPVAQPWDASGRQIISLRIVNGKVIHDIAFVGYAEAVRQTEPHL